MEERAVFEPTGAMTVKEYAEARGKSAQAVYKALQSAQNAAAVAGHTRRERRNGKITMLLDVTAMRVLDDSARVAPVVVNATDTRVQELEEENQNLRLQILSLQQRYIDDMAARDQQLIGLTERVLALTQAPDPEPSHPWWQFWRK